MHTSTRSIGMACNKYHIGGYVCIPYTLRQKEGIIINIQNNYICTHPSCFLWYYTMQIMFFLNWNTKEKSNLKEFKHYYSKLGKQKCKVRSSTGCDFATNLIIISVNLRNKTAQKTLIKAGHRSYTGFEKGSLKSLVLYVGLNLTDDP